MTTTFEKRQKIKESLKKTKEKIKSLRFINLNFHTQT